MATNLQPLTEAHVQLLEKRGISGEIAVRLGWQTCADRKGDWIAIPYLREGRVVNHKYRTLSGEKKFSQDQGGEQCLYNLEAIEDIKRLPAEEQRNSVVYIFEGEMDCAIALQCGYLAVSVPNGAPDKPIESEDSTKFDYLEDFPKFCIAVIATDNDKAGNVLQKELALRLGWHRCKWTRYPKGCKDINEVFSKYGKDGVDRVLTRETKFMNSGGLFKMKELPPEMDIEAYPVNIGNLSEMIKFRAGDAIVVTGIPSYGKTTFVNCVACTMAQDYGWKTCFGSFEQSPAMDHLRYLRTFYLKKQQAYWADHEIAEADAWIDQHFSFIVPDVNTDDLITLKWVLTRVRAAITQYGANLIIIDPWNELDHDRPGGMSLTEYTGFAIKEFKRLAKQYMVTVLIVAHPSKLERNREGGFSVPSLYDISDSAHWYNKFDIGIIIHRMASEKDNHYATLVRVDKVRYWDIIGRVGDRFFEYAKDQGRYFDYPDFVPKKKKTPEKTKNKSDEDSQEKLPYKDK